MDRPAYRTGRRHKPDYWLFVLTGLLLTIGLVVIYSISPGLAAAQEVSQGHFITKQLIDVSLGLAAFAIAAYLPLSRWLNFITPLAVVTILASIVVMFTPVNDIYQAHRWIRVGGYSFQVAELIKFVLILWLARFLSEKWRSGKITDNREVTLPLVGLLLLIGVVVAKFQSDLGSAGVMIAILGLMAYSAGISLKRIGLFAAAVVLFTALAILSTDYRRDRVASFLNPSESCQTTSYQACQAIVSVGSGGLLGQGLGYGVQAYGYLPEPSNDSIFAIMGEKFGFIGSSTIILIYGLFIKRLKDIAVRVADMFSRLIVVGVLAWFSTQMIINVGAMLGLLPLKGITLPLISQGGTSLLCLTAAIGLVYQISRYTSYSEVTADAKIETSNDHSSNRRRFGRAYHTASIARPRT